MRPLRPGGGTDRHRAGVTLHRMETENQKVIGLVLPEDYKITRDNRNRPVLVLTEYGANYIIRMFENVERTIVRDEVRGEAEAAGADMSTYLDWTLANNAIVWTAKGGRVMVQRVEPGDLTPGDARALAQVLNEAADYAEGRN